HLGVAAVFCYTRLISLAHVHARLRDRMPMSIVFFQCLHKTHPRFLVLAFGGKEHSPGHQVGEHTDVMMTLADAHFIHADTSYLAEVSLVISNTYLAKKHSPQPGVRFSNHLLHLPHGHLAHQQQSEGFKLLGEVGAQPFPRRAHPEEMPT